MMFLFLKFLVIEYLLAKIDVQRFTWNKTFHTKMLF